MSIVVLPRLDMFDVSERVSFNIENYRGTVILSLGAMILNGFTRERIIGNVIVPTSCEGLDSFYSGFSKFKYLPNYNTEIGYEKSNVSSPERIICDYFMYDSLKIPQIYDFMEEYGDSINWDFSTTYDMMEKFNLDKSLLDRLIWETKQTMREW